MAVSLCLDLWEAAMPGFPVRGLSRKTTGETSAEKCWDTQSNERQGFDHGTGYQVLGIFSHSDTER